MIRDLYKVLPVKLFGLTRSFILFALVSALITSPIQGQETAKFKEYKGSVVDSKTSKSMEFATVSVNNSNISTVSNIEGVFLLKVPESLVNESVTVSYLGYKNSVVPLRNFTGDDFKIRMEEAFEKLPDVNIVDVNPEKVVEMVMKNRRKNIWE